MGNWVLSAHFFLYSYNYKKGEKGMKNFKRSLKAIFIGGIFIVVTSPL